VARDIVQYCGFNMSNNEFNYKTLCDLADSMAQAATTFSGQGYWCFLQAREEFQAALHDILDSKQQE